MPEEPTSLHLQPGEVSGYLDRRLPNSERARIEAHLADCRDCRREVIDAHRIARSLPGVRVWYWLGTAAAAVAVAILLLSPRTLVSPRGPTERGRDGRDGAPVIDAVAPRAGTVVPRDRVQFVWRSGGRGTSYHLTVTDARGDIVWSGSLSDTTQSLPRAVVLEANRPYAWFVDALLADGRSATTGVQEFRTAP